MLHEGSLQILSKHKAIQVTSQICPQRDNAGRATSQVCQKLRPLHKYVPNMTKQFRPLRNGSTTWQSNLGHFTNIPTLTKQFRPLHKCPQPDKATQATSSTQSQPDKAILAPIMATFTTWQSNADTFMNTFTTWQSNVDTFMNTFTTWQSNFAPPPPPHPFSHGYPHNLEKQCRPHYEHLHNWQISSGPFMKYFHNLTKLLGSTCQILR